jgi:hypothetical protein
MAVFAKSDALVRTKPEVAWASFLAALWIGWFYLFVDLVTRSAVHAISLLALYVASGLCGLAVWNRIWTTRRADVRADVTGLWANGHPIWKRRSRKLAYLRRCDQRIVVTFERRAAPIEVVVDSEQEGHALLAAMELDARGLASSFVFPSGTSGRARARSIALALAPAAVLLLVFEALPLFGMTTTLAVMWLLPLGIYLTLGPCFTRVHVGCDGIRVRHDLRRSSFHPYSTIAGVDLRDADLVIYFRNGRSLSVAFDGRLMRTLLSGRRGSGSASSSDDARNLAARIKEHVARLSDEPTNDLASFVERSGRTTMDWLAAVDRLGDDRADYRGPAMSTEILWRLVEDDNAQLTARAGAAVALRRSINADGRARLRRIAEGSAALRLREVLGAVSDLPDVDEVIARALDPVLDSAEEERAALSARGTRAAVRRRRRT